MISLDFLKWTLQIQEFYNDENTSKIMRYYTTPSYWQTLNIARDENTHSRFIAHYLNPDASHSVGYKFLESFLRLAIIKGAEQDVQIIEGQTPSKIDEKLVQAIMLPGSIKFHEVIAEETLNKTFEESGRFDIFVRFSLLDNATKNKQKEANNFTIEKKYLLVIENKINAKETYTNGVSQTETYFQYLTKAERDYTKIMVLLHAYESTTVVCKDFIRVSYQSMLNSVIDPLLKDEMLSVEDVNRITDYVKCLSIPALEENKKKKQKNLTIMALSENEKELLIDFWEKNKNLLMACFEAISTSDEFDDKAKELAGKVARQVGNIKKQENYQLSYKKGKETLKTESFVMSKALLCYAQTMLKLDSSLATQLKNILPEKVFDTALLTRREYEQKKKEFFAKKGNEKKKYYWYSQIPETDWFVHTGMWKPKSFKKLQDIVKEFGAPYEMEIVKC